MIAIVQLVLLSWLAVFIASLVTILYLWIKDYLDKKKGDK